MTVKRLVLPCFAILLTVFASGGGEGKKASLARGPHPDGRSDSASRARLAANYGKLPLSFEANRGQVDSRVKFLTRGSGYTLFLTADEAMLAMKTGARGHGLSAKGGRQSVARMGHDHAVGLQQSRGLPPTIRRGIYAPKNLRGETQPSNTDPPTSVLSMKLAGANSDAIVVGADELPGKSNYFIGNDPAKWRTNVPTYAKVKYTNVYPGVDLVYYGNQGQLEYDFMVAPGNDPRAIRLDFGERQLAAALPERSSLRGHDGDSLEQAPPAQNGVKTPPSKALRASRYSLRLAGNGDLVVKLDGGDIRLHKPVVYQPSPDNGRPQARIEGRYRLIGRHQVGFEVAAYDRTRPLVIDPAIVYSTFLGGSAYDQADRIAVDGSGNAYITGDTTSTDFPITPGVFQPQCDACNPSTYVGDAYVAKLNATGTALIYSTYLGGSNYDFGFGLSVDATGAAYVTGLTESTDFPTTPGVFQAQLAGITSAFLTKLNATGTALVYSTYLGGNAYDAAYGVAVDGAGNGYLTGYTNSANFPTTSGAFEATCKACNNESTDAFVSKLNPTGTALVYSTYLGGSGQKIGPNTIEDWGMGIEVDGSGNTYVTGATYSTDFPTTTGAFQTTCGGGCLFNGGPTPDAFVTKLNPSGSALVYSTYLGGGNWDEANAIALDISGNAYVAGGTCSTNFPTTPGAFQTVYNGLECESGDAFVTALNPAGSALIYSTYLGGVSVFNDAFGIAADSLGDAYVVGSTASSSFPVTPGAFQTTCGSSECRSGVSFLSEFNPSGTSLLYSTYLGGSGGDTAYAVRLDGSGGVYMVGITGSSNFPVTLGALQTQCAGGCAYPDGFVAKFAFGPVLSPTSLNFGDQTVGITSPAQTATLSNSGTSALTISSIALTGSNGADFAQTNTCGNSLPAGAACNFSITFTPSTTGPESATLSVTDNGVNSPQTVPLSGTGVEPAALLSPTSLTYPVQVVFTSSKPQNVKLSNTGLGILNISSLTTTSNFTQTNTCASTVQPGASCTISVSFLPQNKGPLTGAFTVTDNAPGSPQSVALSGTGTFVQLSPGTINFGNQPVHTTSISRKIALSNKGFAAISITNIGVGGADRKDFGETNTCGSSLASGASCFITVAFTPSALGTRTASVTVLDNGGGSPQSVALTGTGTP